MDDVDGTDDGEDTGSQPEIDRSDPNESSGAHPFDAASQVADETSESNRIIPKAGVIDIVAEPVRYRRGPIYALLAIAVLPAIGLLTVFRWADTEADAYDAEVARVEAERGEGSADSDPAATAPTSSSTTGTATDTATTVAVDGEEQEPELDERDVPLTALLDYRRTPTAIASLANARALSATLDDFADRLDFGVCFAASIDGVRVSAHGSSVPLIPGSVQKLLTAAVALDVLGPDHVFETSIAIPPIVDGEVEGDVYLIGGGDPLLTSDDYPIEDDTRPAFNTTSLDELADAVVDAGVTRIRGTVIGDGTRYDDEFVVESWASGIPSFSGTGYQVDWCIIYAAVFF